MCWILQTTKPRQLDMAVAESVAGKNPDGIGLMWFNRSGFLNTHKTVLGKTGFQDWWYSTYWDAATEAEDAGSELALHMRLATHGAVNVEMAHPFPAGNGVQLMHNGVIDEGVLDNTLNERLQSYGGATAWGWWNTLSEVEDSASDTARYVELLSRVLAKTRPEILRLPEFRRMMEYQLGDFNRILLGFNGDEEKRFYRVGTDGWQQWEGHWVSNTSYIPTRA